ncbi:transposase, partial [Streptomyces virginiae]
MAPVLGRWRDLPGVVDLRSLLDPVLCVNRTGISWRYLPHDYPHWNT